VETVYTVLKEKATAPGCLRPVAAKMADFPLAQDLVLLGVL
jgi:hypothetical protein